MCIRDRSITSSSYVVLHLLEGKIYRSGGSKLPPWGKIGTIAVQSLLLHIIFAQVWYETGQWRKVIRFSCKSWWFGGYLHVSWRSMANEIRRKTTGFSYLFASIITHTSTKHIPWPSQSLGYTKRRLLMPFLCSSCISISSNNIVANLSSCLLKFQHRPPRNIQVSTKPPRFAGKPRNFSPLSRLIPYLSEDNV